MENIDLQMGVNVKAWQNPYNFAHEYYRWMIYQSFKAVLGCRCNKDTLDIMDKNILKSS